MTRLLPPPGLPRRLAVQSAVVAVGWGVYLTGSVVFFKLYVGLPATRIGIGFSIAGFVGLVAAMPLGHLADRIGGKPTWVLGLLVGVVTFLAYPFVGDFWEFVLVLALQTISQAMTDAGRTVYTAAAVSPESRVRTMAFVRSYLNVGFTVGAGVGAAAIGLNSRPGLLALVLVNAAGIAVSTFFVARFPSVRATTGEARPRPWGVVRDHAFSALSTIFAVMYLGEILFSQVVPLWAITATDVPRPVLGGLFALNTVLVVLLQVPATRGADSMTGSARLLRRAALVTAAACPVFALSGSTRGWTTVAVLVLGVLLLTTTELWSSVAQWHFITEVPPPDQRGAYIGAANTLSGVSKMVGPAALTFLAISTGGWGWWVIAALFAAAAAAATPVVSWISRTPRNVSATP